MLAIGNLIDSVAHDGLMAARKIPGSMMSRSKVFEKGNDLFDLTKLNGSIAILQKGLKNKYSWLLKSNNSKIIVIRDLKAINGLDVRME